jgi:hypothetical protein
MRGEIPILLGASRLRENHSKAGGRGSIRRGSTRRDAEGRAYHGQRRDRNYHRTLGPEEVGLRKSGGSVGTNSGKTAIGYDGPR